MPVLQKKSARRITQRGPPNHEAHLLEKIGEKYSKDANDVRRRVLFFRCMFCGELASYSYEAYTTDLSRVSPSML